MRLGLITMGLVFAQLAFSQKLFRAKYVEVGNDRELVSQSRVYGKITVKGIQETRYPQFIEEHTPLGNRFIVELTAANQDELQADLVARNVKPQERDALDFARTAPEVITLVENGPSENRIDLVFMGDGYTLEERDKFIADAQRLTDDMFKGNTFRSYLPLFNVYAVFRASNESGIGKNNNPKDTAYELYRPGDTLRAIFSNNTQAARNDCKAAPDCDYPILMGNDPYYGGLGGEFAITTSSPTSGTMVLRHELGHNFGRVGEEYDGGGYFGANNSTSVSSLKWKHWATEETVKAEPAKARYIKWPWHHLADGPYTANFKSDGKYAFYEIQFSASGIQTDETLDMRIDGERLDTPSPGHSDRAFREYLHEGGLSAGNHKIVVKENVADGDNWLSDLTVFEYGADYHFDRDHIGAYPVFSQSGSVMGYRSNHETCLMRNMKSTDFCAVCQENNWLQFFARIDLIDDIVVDEVGTEFSVRVDVQPLGQFREEVVNTEEALSIRWYRNGTVQTELNDQLEVSIPDAQASGNWEVKVEFKTPEVRKDSQNLLIDRRKVNLSF